MKEQLPNFALLYRELQRCGWNATHSGELAGELLLQTGQGSLRAPTELLSTDRGENLVLLDFGDAQLSDPGELFSRFLDFSLERRMALNMASLVGPTGHLVILSAGQMELYRWPQETLEYRATSQREFEDEFLPALAAKSRPRGDKLVNLPNPLQEARSLKGWITHWSRNIASQIEVNAGDCEKFIWKLILMLQVSRKTGGLDALEAWGLRREKLGDTWTLSYDSVGTHEELSAQLDEFERTFSSRIFSGDSEMHKEWLESLEETSIIEQLRAELLMHSQLKFEAESVAWMFTEVEREQRGWRHDVADLEPLSKRIESEGWYVRRPVAEDVAEFGINAVLRDLDRLAERWSQYDAYLKTRDEAERARLSQPDFLLGFPRGVNERGELVDGVNFILSESIRIEGVPVDEQFGIGLVLLLKVLNYPRQYEWPFAGIDTLDHVWSRA